MPDVRVVLRTDGPAAYGVKLPVVDLLPTRAEALAIGHLGPDPLREDWDLSEAVRRVEADPDRPLVAALLDQRCVAGFGNLWANELCFLRGRSPWTTPGAMQVTTGVRRKGEQHRVAGRAGRPCLRCGTAIRVVAEIGNDPQRRRTWWCPHCQPGPSHPPE